MLSDKIMRIKEVSQVCGISIPTIYRKIKAGTFPSGRRLSSKTTGWLSSEISEWMQSLPKTDI
ncbi:helix-turn-helix transcriptional regulator [Aeromonas veronii]|nr:AlpA family phage regulatory protein [Aeromonas veronii]PZQ96441.1 MAG: AlpA family transcriptional regulator [Aeromonas media]HDX8590770.1 AlpA family phage regulatory protein [Aeromonas dhakensis]HEH9419402.1 AlpA family phage regulatory protein [Aeromonas sobria]